MALRDDFLLPSSFNLKRWTVPLSEAQQTWLFVTSIEMSVMMAASAPLLNSLNYFPSAVLNNRMRVPLVDAVARIVPSADNFIHAMALL